MLEPGTLWARAIAQTRHALDCGALQPIPTEPELIEQAGIQFLVRVLTHLVRKDADKQEQKQKAIATGKDFNPFLPYDPDLFVADLSETHLCLLNKFNVVDYHLLIVTRAFAEQQSPLTLADFEALALGLAEIDGLGFYNSAPAAGSSQRHKHLQLVPLPIAPEAALSLPIAALMPSIQWQAAIGTIPTLPFTHAIAALTPSPPSAAAAALLTTYHQLLAAAGITADAAYNLLTTREWMLLVPRSQEKFESISVNALGFAGTLFVRNAAQLQHLKAIGPLTLLTQVAIPCDRQNASPAQ